MKSKSFVWIVVGFAFFVCSVSLNADIIEFRLTGNGGDGLLESNIDPPTGEIGTGDAGSNGIVYDTVTNILHVHVEWGSGFGYEDLSMDVDRLHLHGPTPDEAPGSFGQTGPLLITLSNSLTFESDRTGGGVDDDFFLDEANESDLLEGRLYVNVHLSDSDTGRIRGYLVASVPEPAALAMLPLAITLVLRRRRK